MASRRSLDLRMHHGSLGEYMSGIDRRTGVKHHRPTTSVAESASLDLREGSSVIGAIMTR